MQTYFRDLIDHIVQVLYNHSLNDWELENLVNGLDRLQYVHEKIKLGLRRPLESGRVGEFTSHRLIVLFHGLGQLQFEDMDALIKSG
jgi:hypothetical protein